MTQYDPGLALDLARWRIDSRRDPRPEAAAAARAAMLAVVASPPRRWRLAALPGAHLPRTHRRLALDGALGGALAVAGVTVGVGWQAPVGSPLHTVRLARERLQLALPGTDGATLRLGFAEQRLADARAGHDPAGLDEAAALLADDRADLPADHTAQPWVRWTRDETELDSLEARLRSGSLSPGGSSPAEPEAGSDAPAGPVRGSAAPSHGGMSSGAPSAPARGGTEPGETAPAGAGPAPSASPPAATAPSSPAPSRDDGPAPRSSPWPQGTPAPTLGGDG
jgi:hypothetical protein